MGTRTVLEDDFRNARRSYVVLGVIGVFAALTGLVFVSEVSVYDDAYRTVFDASALVAFLFPLIVAPLTYLAIAGDRARGSIKFQLGLPNSRGEYFLAKYVSRAGVAVCAVLAAVLVGFVVALAAFTNGADPARFATFAALSSVYAVSVVGVFIAISAVTASRSRAMFAVIGAYFLLVPFWNGMLPVLKLGTLIDFAETLFGVTVSASTRETVSALSPTVAYLQSTEVVYTGVVSEYDSLQRVFRAGPDSLANELWFDLAVMAGWATVAPLLGYLKFRRSELG